MQLCYRGVFYPRSNSTIETTETDTFVTFLGQSCKLRYPVYQPIQERYTLVYRGIPYNTDPTTRTETFPKIAGLMMGLIARQSL